MKMVAKNLKFGIKIAKKKIKKSWYSNKPPPPPFRNRKTGLKS